MVTEPQNTIRANWQQAASLDGGGWCNGVSWCNLKFALVENVHTPIDIYMNTMRAANLQ